MKRILTIAACVFAAPVFAEEVAAPSPYTAEEMAHARHHLFKHHGGASLTFFDGERIEYHSGDGEPAFVWDVEGWHGGDSEKLWVKSEGEVATGSGKVEEAELQLLYSKAVSPFFDLQAGLRQDLEPGEKRTHAVIGVQGTAPYLFEVDAAAFVSHKGEVTARAEIEYELLLTQRLILQPRAEVKFSAQRIRDKGIGAGLTSASLGMRLRYEFKRELAPYIGVSWERDVGRTADFTRAAGEDPSTVSVVAGIKVWY